MMKKLTNQLKITQLSKSELEEREMKMLYGGYDCSCGCLYDDEPYGSSTKDNQKANIAGGYTTPGYGKCDSIIGFISINWYGD